MILADTEILKCLESGSIVIEPFDPAALGSNSYDVHLGKAIAVYDAQVLDAREPNLVRRLEIPPEGLVFEPNELYLGVTEEYTETHEHVPFLEGKSSAGRLGVDIHATAGKGDVGFCNHWTLEISVKKPVRLYAGMPIGQLIYFTVHGKVSVTYARKRSAKYNQRSALPVESLMWKNLGGGSGTSG
ncbi:MAG: dCTP deaminase [Polyangiales bacterium]